MGVSGSDAWGTQIDVPYADIAQIEVRRLETWKTVAVVVVAVLAVDVAAASRSGSHRCCISQ